MGQRPAGTCQLLAPVQWTSWWARLPPAQCAAQPVSLRCQRRGMTPRCLCSYQMKACVRGSSEGPCAPAFPRAYVGFCRAPFSPAAPQKCLLLHVPHSQEDPLFSRQLLPSGSNPSRRGPDRRPALRVSARFRLSVRQSRVLPRGRKAEWAEHFHTREAGRRKRRKRGRACPSPPRLGGDLLTTGQVLQGLSLTGG